MRASQVDQCPPLTQRAEAPEPSRLLVHVVERGVVGRMRSCGRRPGIEAIFA